MGVQVNSYFKSKYTGAQIENMLDAFGNTAAAYETSTAYSVGDLVLYNNALYVCTGATTGAFDPTKWQQTTLAELVENLGATYTDPNNDGNVVVGVDSTVGEKILRSLTFPGLTNRYYLPFAQYIRERLQNDPSSASFSIEIPDAEEAPMHSTVIKGKTVAQNQLAPAIAMPPWAVNTAFGTATVSGGAIVYTITAKNVSQSIYVSNGQGGVPHIKGHKYYTAVDVEVSEAANGATVIVMDSQILSTRSLAANTRTRLEWVYESTKETTDSKWYGFLPNYGDGGLSVGSTAKLYFAQALDLTTRFGETIANEIAALPQADRVSALKSAWLKKYGYPLPQYIPYDAGSLANVNGVYRIRGRNLWNEEWEVGYLKADTGENVGSSGIRSKNYIPCTPNSVIYPYCPNYTSTNRLAFYDANKNYLGTETGWTGLINGREIIVPANARYFRFYVTADNYGEDICLNISDSSFNGTYEPHYDGGEIDCSDAPLNGVGTAQDEKDFATGERTTRCSGVITLDGDTTIADRGLATGRISFDVSLPMCAYTDINAKPLIISDKLGTITQAASWNPATSGDYVSRTTTDNDTLYLATQRLFQ